METGSADAVARKARFLKLLDGLLERLESVPRMDIRDYIAALSLVDRVMAREKTDDNAERAGSKVREYQSSFQAANGSARRGSDPRQPVEPAEPDDESGADDRDDSEPHDRDDEDRPAI